MLYGIDFQNIYAIGLHDYGRVQIYKKISNNFDVKMGLPKALGFRLTLLPSPPTPNPRWENMVNTKFLTKAAKKNFTTGKFFQIVSNFQINFLKKKI